MATNDKKTHPCAYLDNYMSGLCFMSLFTHVLTWAEV